MRALHIAAINQLAVVEVPDPFPSPGEVVVRLKAAALNHRDVWIKLGQYAGLKYPCIPGSDGAGVVAATGEGVDPAWNGREVIINPSLGWGPSEHFQGPDFNILGLPRSGTLAQFVAVPATQLASKPEHLSWTEAAALPLAGLTAWRALSVRAQLNPDDRVLVSGIGAGTALFALQYAVTAGAEVWVTSSSEAKIARAVTLGAKGGFLYTQAGWAKAAEKQAGQFNVIIDSAGGPGFEDLVNVAAPGGRIVVFGATRGDTPSLALRKIFWRQLSVLGSTMGSPLDWTAMTRFVEMHRIKPVVSDVFAFGQAPAAFALMEKGGQFGKIVVEIE